MSDNVFKLISLLIQASGVAYLIFRLGKYMGESNMMFKTLFEEVKSIKLTHESHASEDDDRHEKVAGDIVDIKIDVAGFTEKRQHSRRRGDQR